MTVIEDAVLHLGERSILQGLWARNSVITSEFRNTSIVGCHLDGCDLSDYKGWITRSTLVGCVPPCPLRAPAGSQSTPKVIFCDEPDCESIYWVPAWAESDPWTTAIAAGWDRSPEGRWTCLDHPATDDRADAT